MGPRRPTLEGATCIYLHSRLKSDPRFPALDLSNEKSFCSACAEAVAQSKRLSRPGEWDKKCSRGVEAEDIIHRQKQDDTQPKKRVSRGFKTNPPMSTACSKACRSKDCSLNANLLLPTQKQTAFQDKDRNKENIGDVVSKSRKDRSKKVLADLFDTANKEAPKLVNKGLAYFTRTSYNGNADESGVRYKKSRQSDLDTVISGSIDALATVIMPDNPDGCLPSLQKAINTKTNQQSKKDTSFLREAAEIHDKKKFTEVESKLVKETHRQVSISALEGIISVLKKKKPGKKRIPHLSLIVKSMNRKQASILLGSQVSKYEWTQANMHHAYPGPGEPIPHVIHSRFRVDKKVLEDALDLLVSPDIMQQTAYGRKLLELTRVPLQEIDAVQLKVSFRKATEHYLRSIFLGKEALAKQGFNIPENRCSEKDAFRCQCLLEKGHSGNHTYTPKGYALSGKSFYRLATTLSAGESMSLAGLDDDEVVNGHLNFMDMREMAIYCNDTLHKKDKKLELLNAIEDIETFHKTAFVQHISDNNPAYKCQCIRCGFNCMDDPVFCTKKGKHHGSCKKCNESFCIIDKLEKLIKEAADYVSKQDQSSPATIRCQEQLEDYQAEIEKCYDKLKSYRSHLVLKKTESDAAKKSRVNLQDHEAIVICDWKMKILAAFFRENKVNFFGKRGTSCLGFMVITNSKEETDKKMVHFHLMFTDDTCQDTFSVNCGKTYLYSELLPKFVTKAHYQCDGAGCYSGNSSKAMITTWYQNTGITEETYTQSPAGGGKSVLDGIFGRLAFILRRAVNSGHDYTNAKEVKDAFDNEGGINGVTSHLFTPVRSDDENNMDSIETKIEGLKSFYKLVLLPTGDVKGYYHSDYGEGHLIKKEDIEKAWVNGVPQTLLYSRTPQSETDWSAGYRKHDIDDYVVRVKEAKKCKLEKSQILFEDRWKTSLEEKRRSGLFPCDCVDEFRGPCKMVYARKYSLDNHVRKGTHNFGSLNMTTYAIQYMSQPGQRLSSGSNPDRNHATSITIEERDFEEHSGLVAATRKDWLDDGCYNKPKRKDPRRNSPYILQDLENLFLEGEATDGNKKNKSKHTYISVYDTIKSLPCPEDPDRRKYTSNPNNKYGPMMPKEDVKAWLSQRSDKTATQVKAQIEKLLFEEKNYGKYAAYKVADLKNLLMDRCLPISGTKKILVARLLRCDGNNYRQFLSEDEVKKVEVDPKKKKSKTEKSKRSDSPAIATTNITSNVSNYSDSSRSGGKMNDAGSSAEVVNARSSICKDAATDFCEDSTRSRGASKRNRTPTKNNSSKGSHVTMISPAMKKMPCRMTPSPVKLLKSRMTDKPQSLRIFDLNIPNTKSRLEDEILKISQFNINQSQSLSMHTLDIDAFSALSIGNEDVNRLIPGKDQMLNDNIIDFCGIILNRHQPRSSPSRMIFNSQIFQQLMDYGPEKVSEQLTRKGINIFAFERILFPVVRHKHWSLISIFNPNFIQNKRDQTRLPFILFLDSSFGKFHDADPFSKKVRKLLNMEWKRTKTPNQQPFNVKSMPLLCPKVPQQDSGTNACGLFMIHFASAIYKLPLTLLKCNGKGKEYMLKCFEDCHLFSFDHVKCDRFRESLYDLMKYIQTLS